LFTHCSDFYPEGKLAKKEGQPGSSWVDLLAGERKLENDGRQVSITIAALMKKKQPDKKFHIISLGCAKNSVDSRSMAELLDRTGWSEVEKAQQADVVVVNTCGFIQPARQGSLAELQLAAKKKKKGQWLIAAGCLTQLDREEIIKQVPGIDGLLGTRRWMDIVKLVSDLQQAAHPPVVHFPSARTVGLDEHGVLRAAVQGSSAYLKIGDGCDRACAFCAIPIIKGLAVSRPMEDIVRDARQLALEGVKELVLISQDTTSYGRDLGMEDGLPTLLEKLVQSTPDMAWIRILYTFPGSISERLITVMASHTQILPYLDLPLQHAHPDVLRRMHRPRDMQGVRSTIHKMRRAMPDLALRTTFIVGFPGESDEEFKTLLDFAEEIQFDRVGIFPYYAEQGTAAFDISGAVLDELKEERLQLLAETQQKISLARNQTLIGRTLPVLVEGVDNNLCVGRSYRDAPEIDGLVIAEGQVQVGEMVNVQVTGAMVHDLTGTVIA